VTPLAGLFKEVDFDLGGAKRRMCVIVSLIRGETPLIGETLRKGFHERGVAAQQRPTGARAPRRVGGH